MLGTSVPWAALRLPTAIVVQPFRLDGETTLEAMIAAMTLSANHRLPQVQRKNARVVRPHKTTNAVPSEGYRRFGGLCRAHSFAPAQIDSNPQKSREISTLLQNSTTFMRNLPSEVGEAMIVGGWHHQIIGVCGTAL